MPPPGVTAFKIGIYYRCRTCYEIELKRAAAKRRGHRAVDSMTGREQPVRQNRADGRLPPVRLVGGPGFGDVGVGAIEVG